MGQPLTHIHQHRASDTWHLGLRYLSHLTAVSDRLALLPTMQIRHGAYIRSHLWAALLQPAD